jgi:hypothetical protein
MPEDKNLAAMLDTWEPTGPSIKKIQELREKYKLPNHYTYACCMPDGRVVFDYRDADITIHPDGRAFHTYGGFDSWEYEHTFHTEEWMGA